MTTDPFHNDREIKFPQLLFNRGFKHSRSPQENHPAGLEAFNLIHHSWIQSRALSKQDGRIEAYGKGSGGDRIRKVGILAENHCIGGGPALFRDTQGGVHPILAGQPLDGISQGAGPHTYRSTYHQGKRSN
ncbi:hypothetical protein DSY1542 [Desulfitobacterium hafniense Y51]|uniref:Uncharacterized protein n=1 Tax=Desulfitobacterium hafniense (strain Y51) TaxID=138119 RepID=Q24XB1_DESHY|nr:hypothetical protein DSY1542 [Desulfitobacterium hafniense Y51]